MSNELQQDRIVKAGDPYTRTHWENNKTPLNAANLNNIENGIEENTRAIINETNERKLADIAINTELDAVEKKTGFVYDEKNGKVSFNLPELLTILNSTDLSDLQKGVNAAELLENYTLSQMFMMLYTMYFSEVGDMYSPETASDGTKTYSRNISDGLENRMGDKTLISAINNLYYWVKTIIGINDYEFQLGYSNAKDKFADIHSDLSSLSSVVQIFNKIYESVLNNKSSIQLLNSSEDVEGSVKNTVITEIAKVVAGAPEDLNTLKEIADWIESHPETVAEINSSIKSNTDAINEIKENYATKDELDEVASKVSENIDISNLISYGNDYPSGDITTQYYVKLDDTEVIVKNEEQGKIDVKVVVNGTTYSSSAEYYREGNLVYVTGSVPNTNTGTIIKTFTSLVNLYFETTNDNFYKPVLNTDLKVVDTGSYSVIYNTNGVISKKDLTAPTLPDGGSFSFQFITKDPFYK